MIPTNKIKTIIVDDEAIARQGVAGLIQLHFKDKIEIVGFADSVSSAIKAIEQECPDLILLDIQLKDENSFDILRRVSNKNFKIIFITGFQEFAIQAIKFCALDYLLKPIDELEFINAINKVQKNIDTEHLDLKLKTFFENLSKPAKSNNIILKTLDTIYSIPIEDIIRCESNGNYTTFYAKDNKQILVSRQLKEFESLLSDQDFFRTHSSHLINIKYFNYLKKIDDGIIFLKDGSQVPLARSKKDAFLKLLH